VMGYPKRREIPIELETVLQQRTCIRDFLSMHFSLYTLMKDVHIYVKVWGVIPLLSGPFRPHQEWEATSNKLLAIC
jgi:hypothetical protein